jgi:hypothetical protein
MKTEDFRRTRARKSAYAGAMKALDLARLATSRVGRGTPRRGGLKCTRVNSVNVRVGGSSVGHRGHDVSRVRVGYRRRTVGITRCSTKSKSVPPRLLLLASFRRLASGAHWSVTSECAFVSQRALRKFFAGKFVPYFSSDAYYSTHVYYPKTVDSIRETDRAYRAQGFP